MNEGLRTLTLQILGAWRQLVRSQIVQWIFMVLHRVLIIYQIPLTDCRGVLHSKLTRLFFHQLVLFLLDQRNFLFVWTELIP